MSVRVILLALAMAGCSGASGARPSREALTLRTASSSQQMALANDGGITGPRLELRRTETGYRGMVDAQLVDLRSDGERIVGSLRGRIVDLHVSRPDEGGVRAQGLFAGVLGRLEATPWAIQSSLGICQYALRAAGHAYEGETVCGHHAGVPRVRPAALELPAGFERLSLDRQAMLLAILLSS